MSKIRFLPVALLAVLSTHATTGWAKDVTYPLDGSAPVVQSDDSSAMTQMPKGDLTSCQMHYHLSGFSLVFRYYTGTGEITCRNGQRANAALTSTSIGFSIGKSEFEGVAHFSEVKGIDEIWGNYMSLESHAGFLKSFDAQLLTRGEISMALDGQGRGVDIGATIGNLNIIRR